MSQLRSHIYDDNRARLIGASLMTPRSHLGLKARIADIKSYTRVRFPARMNCQLRFHGEICRRSAGSHIPGASRSVAKIPSNFVALTLNTQRSPLPVLPTVLRKIIECMGASLVYGGTIMTVYRKIPILRLI